MSQFEKLPSKEEARKAFWEAWEFAPETELVELGEALGRVAAEDLTSNNLIPVMRISAMDGFAVKSELFDGNALPDVSEWKIHRDYEPADTGDDFPDEFDTVIPIEDLHYGEGRRLEFSPEFTFTKGANIRPSGCMMQPGDLLVEKNTKLTPEHLAGLAAGGVVEVPVRKRPVVAFIPTGSELVNAHQKPERGQNVDSNTFLIASYLKMWGAEVDAFPIARDSTLQLEWAMDDALKTADIVILNGGSSKGTEDFNSKLIERRASFYQHGVSTVPGRPVSLAIVDGKPVINMPGPSMAAFTVADWLVRPMLARWYGLPEKKRISVEAELTEDFKKPPMVELYAKVHVEEKDGKYYAVPLQKGVRYSEMMREGNGILIGALGSSGAKKGDIVTVEILGTDL